MWNPESDNELTDRLTKVCDVCGVLILFSRTESRWQRPPVVLYNYTAHAGHLYTNCICVEFSPIVLRFQVTLLFYFIYFSHRATPV